MEPVDFERSFPQFKYHPDPLKTGNIEKSDKVCICCGKATGFIYVGPYYAVEDLDEQLCPWCIASGVAAKKYKAVFTDTIGVGGGGLWESVPDEVVDEITKKTPGFCGWQQERWWTHCGDGAQFLGLVGFKEAKAAGDDFLEFIRDETGLVDDEEWEHYLSALDRDGSPTAYLFRCRHCGKLGGYSDCD